MKLQTDLKGKRALIGGSTQGIGLACAKLLARNGAEVVLLARNEATLKTALYSLENDHGQEHSYICADFSSPADLESALKRDLPASKPVDIVINNTGGPPGGAIYESAPEAFRVAFNMHLICNQIIVQHCLPSMRENNWGRIINIISTSVKLPLKGLGVSNTIRGAVANWSKTMANELGQWGITVNNILPGATSTQRLESIIDNKSQKTGASKVEVSKQMLSSIPANRFAEAEEIAFGALFLASDAAAYINGINLPIDGGRTGSL